MVSKEKHHLDQELDPEELKMPKEKDISKHRHGEKNLARDVDKYTKRGTKEIEHGNLQKALENFERAFVKAQKLGARFPIRACAFNLGAVYIAAKEPEKGIEILQCAIPPDKKCDGKSNGDLFFNFALGYDALNNSDETTRYLELALEDYQTEKVNYKMEAEVARKLADIYMELGEWLSGARANGLAARAYAMLSDSENQAVVTCHEARCLFQGRRHDLALQIADGCMTVCQKVSQGATLGYVYNELGLTYSQCHDFGKAATCFELALPLSRGRLSDKNQEAVILQNLGAIYNSIGDFQRAVGIHKEAARRYAETNNRNAQGKCFTNMAYAFSQLGDTEMAGEFYLHALQSARDTGDLHAHWQALEGLGAVAFNEAQYQKAVQYFKAALSLVSSSEDNKRAQDRIVGKLSDSIHFLANKGSAEDEEKSQQVDILVNDLPRPPTREERRQMEIMALRRGEARFLMRRPNDFETVPLGVSEYSTDDDVSLERRSHSRQRTRSKRGSRMKRASSVSSSQTGSKKHTAEVDGPRPYQLNLTRRISSAPKDSVDGRRIGSVRQSLLKAGSSDSEEEHMEFDNQRRRGLSSSDAGDDELNDYLKKKMYPDLERPEVERPGSRHTLRSHSIVETSLKQSLKRVDMPDAGDTDSRCKTPSTHYSEPLSESDDCSLRGRKIVAQIVAQNLEENRAVLEISEHKVEESNHEQDGKDRDSVSNAKNGSKDQDSISSAKNETKGEDDVRNSEDNGNTEHCEEGLKTDLSKLPPPPPIPLEQSPNATYMPPVKRTEEEDESSDSETESEEESDEESDALSEEETHQVQQNHSMGNYMTSSRPNKATAHITASKKHESDGFETTTAMDENPIYQTIVSAKNTAQDIKPEPLIEPVPGPSLESDEGPPLPPRPSFETMTRAEKEAFLFEYQRKRDETIKKREDDAAKENEYLTQKNKNKISKACVVM